MAWAGAYGQGYVRDAIHWFFHKFNVDLVETLRAFKATARLMCPATALFLNPTPASVHWRQQLRVVPFLNEGIIMDGLCQDCQHTRLARAEGVSFEADSTADLAAKKVELGGVRMRIICHIGQVQ